jgi:hypothetical protein
VRSDASHCARTNAQRPRRKADSSPFNEITTSFCQLAKAP